MAKMINPGHKASVTSELPEATFFRYSFIDQPLGKDKLGGLRVSYKPKLMKPNQWISS